MNEKYEMALVKALVGQIIFLEFTDESKLNLDDAVTAQEQISLSLAALDRKNKIKLSNTIQQCATDFPDEFADFIQTIPQALNLRNESI